MKKHFLAPLIAWEAIVLVWIAVVMVVFGKTLNAENVRKLATIAGFGVLVVLICWPICRLLSRTAGWAVGTVIGLPVPPISIWILGWFRPDMLSIETGILGMVLCLPSGLGGMVVGGLQARQITSARANGT